MNRTAIEKKYSALLFQNGYGYEHGELLDYAWNSTFKRWAYLVKFNNIKKWTYLK